jgi:hypothetical protein
MERELAELRKSFKTTKDALNQLTAAGDKSSDSYRTQKIAVANAAREQLELVAALNASKTLQAAQAASSAAMKQKYTDQATAISALVDRAKSLGNLSMDASIADAKKFETALNSLRIAMNKALVLEPSGTEKIGLLFSEATGSAKKATAATKEFQAEVTQTAATASAASTRMAASAVNYVDTAGKSYRELAVDLDLLKRDLSYLEKQITRFETSGEDNPQLFRRMTEDADILSNQIAVTQRAMQSLLSGSNLDAAKTLAQIGRVETALDKIGGSALEVDMALRSIGRDYQNGADLGITEAVARSVEEYTRAVRDAKAALKELQDAQRNVNKEADPEGYERAIAEQREEIKRLTTALNAAKDVKQIDKRISDERTTKAEQEAARVKALADAQLAAAKKLAQENAAIDASLKKVALAHIAVSDATNRSALAAKTATAARWAEGNAFDELERATKEYNTAKRLAEARKQLQLQDYSS